MKRIIKISYQNRQSRAYGGSGIGSLSRDLPTAPKLVLANHFISKVSKIEISDKVSVQYLSGQIVISKLIT